MPMQSRTDQVHSYQFFLQRVVSGLVARESDPAELPFRRLGWSAFGGFMIAVLVAAGFGVYGLLVGGGATGWQDGGSVIVEKGSETAYIYRNERLHPMVNIVSAQLALGGDAGVTRVSARSLAGVPRGLTLGIPGAPDGLPAGGSLLTGGWTLCTQQRPDGSGGSETFSVLAVGQPPAGGQPVADRAVLVRDAGAGGGGDAGDDVDVGLHLVWHGHRFEVDARALRALGTGQQRTLPVAPAWLDTLPVGDPLAPGQEPDRGQPTRALGELRSDLGVRTGQVLESAGLHYLVGLDRLREITPLSARILLNDPATGDAYPDGEPDLRTDLPDGALNNAHIDLLPGRAATSPPEQPPELVALAPEDLPVAPVCAGFAPGGFTPEIWSGARLPWQAGGITTPQRTGSGGLLADQVLVEGGRAALVRAVPAPDAPGGTWHLVTDQGIQFRLSAPEVAGMLGYRVDAAVPIAAGLLARLPAGPALDPAQADQPVPLVNG
ncbi:MAG: type VII secretion protein EccB [Micromonosporaceae bacterium]|nr:type VII secretion protein EccB [Micromonosporaceae bacterium]